MNTRTKHIGRRDYINLVAGPSPISIFHGSQGFFCEDRKGDTWGPFKTERVATKKAYHLVERGRHPDAHQTKREINAEFERRWRGR